MALDKEDLNKLTEAIKAGQTGNSGGSSGVLSGGADKVISGITAPMSALGTAVGNNTKIFETLSNTGTNFSNNIDLMKLSAANSRMTLDELSNVVQKSGKDFSGLGGSVAKGGQAFTEFSKTFFDSGLTDNLRQMGYTSKDLNEVLATQIGFQKSTTDTSVAGQIKTAAAAADLANEMDLIAKQTGKTRKEQEAGLEKAKADGQIEAKMRLIGLTQGADAEKEARAGFAKQLAQAQAMGTDQIFKEMFATGTVRSQEAAMQMGLLGQAARETANSAKALSTGNIAASQTAMESAKEGNLANQSNKALMQLTAAGVGPAADVMKKNIETNDAAFQGASKTAKAMGIEMGEVTKILGAQKKAIQDEQQARNGATSAMIAVQSRLADANAAANNLVRKPLMTGEANTQLQGVANRFSQGVKPGESATKTAEGYADALVKSAAAGGESKAPTSSRTKYEAMGADGGVSRLVTGADKLAAGGIKGASTLALKASNFIGDAMKVYQINKDKLETRDEGTLGKTGSAVEPQDFIGKVAKGEMVLTPEQAKKFMEGAKTEGIADAVKNLGGMMPGSAKGDGGGFSLSSLSKEISTSVSSVTSGSSITQRTQTDDSKQAQEELNELKKQANAEKEAVREKIKGQLGPDATNREKHKAVRDSDELKGLEEKYNSLMEPLQKKIEAGIKWETETKSEQVEETKNFVKEQAEILKVSNSDLLTLAATGSTEKIDIEKEAKEKLAELAKTVNPALEKATAPVTKGIDAKSIASAMPATPKFDKSKFSMPSMDQLTIGPDGMPKISAKPQAQTIPAAVKPAEKQASPGKKINEETGEEYTPVGDAKKSDKKTAVTETKTATLDDVAKLLSSLNTTMKQIASAASETNNKLGQQVKATKAMSGNVHGAT
jgi:hypothetical protein